MSNQTISPGALLAGRYRIAELLAEIDGARVWRAVDEVLSRPVVVDVLSAEDERTDALFDAARRAAAANDPRFLRVLDCDIHDGTTYCVREWAGGRPLERMLGAGPLTGQQAGWLAREVAEALEHLHRAGIQHGAISPATVVVTDAGAIKVVGVATEAALRSAGPGSPEDDVRALGQVLFASLTGRWPGPTAAWGLQPAPFEHGRLLTPRQVRAGVPRSLDDISDRLLGDPPRHHAAPITSAAGLSAALSGVIGSSHEPPSQLSDETVAIAQQNGSVDDATVMVPNVAAPALEPDPVYTRPPANSTPRPPYEPGPDARPVRRRQGPVPESGAAMGNGANGSGGRRRAPEEKAKGGWGGRILILLAILALLSVVAMAQFLAKDAFKNEQGAGSSPKPSVNQPPPAQKLKIVDAKDFDPKPDGSGDEHPKDVPNTYDGDLQTTWDTMSYKKRPDLGGTKEGVGIYYDLGSVQDVTQVNLALVGDGTSLDIRIPAEDPATPGKKPDDWKKVGSVKDAGESASVKLDPGTKSRYVLVWLTSLPKADDGDFVGEIAEVTIQK
ncbi:hypothetical protein [Kribbella deserti]|uniref:non-specific serine/threonine protein kinase n=1 Tax=Kribbella deserti TaxID=1926257 RepID=A0ABV6QLE4_9ACTN